MNNKRDNSWSKIEITNDPTVLEGLELSLTDDTDEEGNPNDKQAPQDTRRANFTVSKNTNEDQENKDDTPRPQVQKNQEQRAVPPKQTRQTTVVEEDEDDKVQRDNRGDRRIQNLTRVKNQQEQVISQLARRVQELESTSRASDKRNAITMRDNFKQALDDAEAQLEAANTSNDTAKAAKLTRTIADLTMRHNAYTAVAEEFENEPEPQKQQFNQPQPVEIPEEAKSWIKRNPWFLQKDQFDEIKHIAARKISAEITEEGIYDPNDQDYWSELDKRLRKKFNEADPENNEQNQEVEQPQRTSQRPRKGPVSSSRSDEDESYSFNNDTQFQRNGNRVRATPNQDDHDMAERLGMKVEDLMKEKYKYAQQDYKGYVKIDIPG